MVCISAGVRNYQAFCPKSKTGRPCYSPRCPSANCRNKYAWKEYTILVRSLQRLPASHYLVLNFPDPLYTGHDVVVRINQFFKLLRRRVRREVPFYWYYDGQAVGRFAHVNVLVRSPGLISSEDVLACWRETWAGDAWGDEIDDTSAHVQECDDEVAEIARYVTKHNDKGGFKRVTKGMWCGRLCGGSNKFWVRPKRQLWEEPHYRSSYDARDYYELEKRFEACCPELAYGVADTSLEAGVNGGDSALSVSSLPTHLRPTINRPVDHSRHTRPADMGGSLPCCMWPIPPPRSLSRWWW